MPGGFMIYVASDLHGYYDEFLKMLEIIDFQNDDFIYIVGDVVDRGPESIKLLRYIMKQSNMQLIMGNHDQTLLWAAEGNTSPFPAGELMTLWEAHGGRDTYAQFLALAEAQRKEIVDFLKTIPYYIILDEFLLVHAAIAIEGYKDDDIETVMRKQTHRDLLWETYRFLTHPLNLKKHTMIFGHTFTLMIRQICGQPMDSVDIWKDKCRIGIDCGYLYGGRMAVLRLDDMKEFYLSPSGIVSIKNTQGDLLKRYRI